MTALTSLTPLPLSSPLTSDTTLSCSTPSDCTRVRPQATAHRDSSATKAAAGGAAKAKAKEPVAPHHEAASLEKKPKRGTSSTTPGQAECATDHLMKKAQRTPLQPRAGSQQLAAPPCAPQLAISCAPQLV